MKKNFVLLLLVTASIIVSCKKDGGGGGIEVTPAVTPVGANDGTPISKTIGSGGGGITSTDGEMELIIPAGALTTDTEITIQPITNNAPNGRGKAYRCTPNGLQFAKDITVKFKYTEEDATLTKPEYMRAAFQTAEGTWQPIEKITNDVSGNILSASVNHFTDFSAFDILRLVPASMYLKPGATGNFEISYAGMDINNFNQLGYEILNQSVTWKANGVTNGNATHGTIRSVSPIKATYTAPATAPANNPIAVSVELDIPFVVDGQQFNKGILTANVFIVGAQYSVLIESTFILGIGTSEKFSIKDAVTFNVNLTGAIATITNIQNSEASIQKIENSPFNCNTTIESSGSGGINLLDGDVTGLTNPIDHLVYLSFDQTGTIIHPKAITTCQGNTPGHIDLVAANSTGGVLEFIDNGQQQVKTETTTIHTVKYTIIPLP